MKDNKTKCTYVGNIGACRIAGFVAAEGEITPNSICMCLDEKYNAVEISARLVKVSENESRIMRELTV